MDEEYEAGLIKITAILVFVLGIVVTGSLFLSPPGMEQSPAARGTASAGATMPVNRSTDGQDGDTRPDLAPGDAVSMNTTSLPKKNNPADRTVRVIDLNCAQQDRRAKIRVASGQIRLKGRLCGPGWDQVARSSIVNRSNGFVATIFFPDKNRFTTDYIALGPGENSIAMSYTSGEGAESTTQFIIESCPEAGGSDCFKAQGKSKVR